MSLGLVFILTRHKHKQPPGKSTENTPNLPLPKALIQGLSCPSPRPGEVRGGAGGGTRAATLLAVPEGTASRDSVMSGLCLLEGVRCPEMDSVCGEDSMRADTGTQEETARVGFSQPQGAGHPVSSQNLPPPTSRWEGKSPAP